MLKKTRRIAAAAVVLPAVLAFAACGKSETPSTAGSSSGTSASQTSDAPASGKFATTEELKAALEASAKNLKSLHMSVTGAEGFSMEGDIDQSAGRRDFKMTLKLPQGGLEVISVKGVVYVGGFPGVPAGKYISSEGAAGEQVKSLTDQLKLDELYTQFTEDVTAVKYVASETLDGVAVDKYELTISEKSKAQTGTLWLDGDNRIRKVSGLDADGNQVTGTFTKIDEMIIVEAPRMRDIVTIPS